MVYFWTEALGARLIETRRFGTAEGAALELDGLRIYLRLAKEGENPEVRGETPISGYDHLGLETDDLDSAMARLMSRGSAVVSGPATKPGRRTVFMTGPENILFELMEIREK